MEQNKSREKSRGRVGSATKIQFNSISRLQEPTLQWPIKGQERTIFQDCNVGTVSRMDGRTDTTKCRVPCLRLKIPIEGDGDGIGDKQTE